jgi:L,D-peptidoglycan transpeptidase YkuD (ErfK/YbiS/YcfS/YnhG family)
MDIHVDSTGFLSWTDAENIGHRVRCAFGRGGIGEKSGEGDGITPLGQYPLRAVMVRADRVAMPHTDLPVSKIRQNDGWCDDPASPNYNTRITLPHSASHEELWRDDGLYDVVVEVGYNDDPVKAERGSAIFMHVARPGYEPTEGCVALAIDDLLRLLRSCNSVTRLSVNP